MKETWESLKRSKERERIVWGVFRGNRFEGWRQQFVAGWLESCLLIDLQVTADVTGPEPGCHFPTPHLHPHSPAHLRSVSLPLFPCCFLSPLWCQLISHLLSSVLIQSPRSLSSFLSFCCPRPCSVNSPFPPPQWWHLLHLQLSFFGFLSSLNCLFKSYLRMHAVANCCQTSEHAGMGTRWDSFQSLQCTAADFNRSSHAHV